MKKKILRLARSLDHCIEALSTDLDWFVFEEAPFFNELLPAVLPFFIAEFLMKTSCMH